MANKCKRVRSYTDLQSPKYAYKHACFDLDNLISVLNFILHYETPCPWLIFCEEHVTQRILHTTNVFP